MLFIISCHFCQYYGNEWAWWLNVGVQIFFTISGFLYGNKEIKEPISWLKKQFSKILIPYYVFLILAITAYAIACPEILTLSSLAHAVFCLPGIKGLGHLWFVSYIMFCYLLTPLLYAFVQYYKNRGYKYHLLIFMAVFCLTSILGIATRAYFVPGNILCYISGYFIAVLYHRFGMKSLKAATLITVPLALLTNLVYAYFKYVKGTSFEGILRHATDYSHLFLGLAITLLLMLVLRQIKGNIIFSWSDKYSYEIYLVHQLFILSPLTLLTLFRSAGLNIIVTLAVILLSGFILKRLDIFTENRLLKRKDSTTFPIKAPENIQ